MGGGRRRGVSPLVGLMMMRAWPARGPVARSPTLSPGGVPGPTLRQNWWPPHREGERMPRREGSAEGEDTHRGPSLFVLSSTNRQLDGPKVTVT